METTDKSPKGVEAYLEQSLGEYPLIYDYINEEVGGNRPFLSNGERSRKLVISVPAQPTYLGWLNHQNYFKAQEPVGEKV